MGFLFNISHLDQFPDSLTSIGNYAFEYIYGLKRMIFRGAAPTVGNSVFTGIGQTVSGGTQMEFYESHRSSFSGSPWTSYTLVGVPDPALEAFALTSVFDASNSSLSIHSHVNQAVPLPPSRCNIVPA